MNHGFIRVAAAVPKMKVGDIDYNVAQILEFAKKASDKGSSITVFPELSITGYTMGDLFHQQLVIEKSKEALNRIAKSSRNLKSLILVGLPIAFEGKLFNSAAIISKGKILGLVPKTHIPNYKEFYEERWFASGYDLYDKEVEISAHMVPIGTDLLFRIKNSPEIVLGVEICEDLWVPIPPSSFQTVRGATIIANLSASNDLIAKADYRKNLVAQQSARGICGYIYTSCGVHESTTDVVFGGHAIIAENGSILAESKRFQLDGELVLSEIDIQHLISDRERTSSFNGSVDKAEKKNFRFIDFDLNIPPPQILNRYIDSTPFVPSNPTEKDKRAEEIFSIQAIGLVKRLNQSGIKRIVLGLSGGLDSTLALLVAVKAFKLLNLPLKNIYAYTMPGFGTTKRTKSNAVKLAEALGTTLEEIDITKGAYGHLKEIGHDGKNQDLTFQNVQARYRTLILMDKANFIGGLVLGTGDLSEIALGWCTFNGDQISHYNVNASIPKTLVKHLVNWVSEQKDFKEAHKILTDIIDTPISPELIKNKGNEISQKTEELIGPYELHDFFLYHFIRWNSSPAKILFLANKVFAKKYKPDIIKKWLIVFVTRFFQNQWKRSVMPDGPKVGSVALSPRGDWRMPSDAEAKLWLKELRD
ncbi:MAG: NAD(+) synthase [Candidatus Yanofskybacteria bacterium]|nr:NAD(+) synthase [Candidatus Yanofskybacteria bacterium]